MIKTKHAPFKSIWKQHRLLLLIIGVLIAIAAALLVWHELSAQQDRAKDAKEYAAFIEESDALIQKLTKERKEREAAALKEQQAAEIAEQARQNPEAPPLNARSGQCNHSGKHADPTRIDVVVNKKHCMQPLSFAPTDLVVSNGATLSAKAVD